jgi:formamidopyrimidine-DNA glycosylase
MPELPEVETARRVLEQELTAATVEAVGIRNPQVIARPSAADFGEALTGRRIAGFGRRGKYLHMHLDGDGTVVVHLRMTGHLSVAPPGLPEEKHTHVRFDLGDGRSLRFTDPRRFGRLWLVDTGDEGSCCASDLGPEPWDPLLTGDLLRERLGRSRRAVKSCLNDQGVVAGIGNIYSDEILFCAGIRPDTPGCALSSDDFERLAGLIPDRMGFFTEANAVTPCEYAEDAGRRYRNTPHLQVYGRAGRPCTVCGTTLVRTVVGGRGSVHCPCCQPPAPAAKN